MVMAVNEEEQDVKIKFLHPHGPARSFFWPAREDICFVPFTHILTTIDMPGTATGRQYRISERDSQKINSVFYSETSQL